MQQGSVAVNLFRAIKTSLDAAVAQATQKAGQVMDATLLLKDLALAELNGARSYCASETGTLKDMCNDFLDVALDLNTVNMLLLHRDLAFAGGQR